MSVEEYTMKFKQLLMKYTIHESEEKTIAR